MNKSLIITLCLFQFCLASCTSTSNLSSQNNESESEITMKIKIENSNSQIVYELNDSNAAKSLLSQLPLTVAVENFSNNEKVFYPPTPLNTTGTPLADHGIGSLAYYAPWGDVVMFYGNYSRSSSLYYLGHVVSGGEDVQNLVHGENITISIVE